MYGARGSNGVIMVTTKRGTSERVRVSFDAKAGFNSRGVPSYDVISDPGEYYEMTWEALRNAAYYRTENPMSASQADYYASGALIRLLKYNVYRGINDGRTYYIYKCSRYAVHGKSTCSIHHIPASALEEAVLQNIRFNAQLLSENDEELLEKLIALGNRGQQCEMQKAKTKLNEAVKRLEIVDFGRQLYRCLPYVLVVEYGQSFQNHSGFILALWECVIPVSDAKLRQLSRKSKKIEKYISICEII